MNRDRAPHVGILCSIIVRIKNGVSRICISLPHDEPVVVNRWQTAVGVKCTMALCTGASGTFEGDGHMLVGDAYLVLERQTEISMRQKSEPKVVADR